MFVETQHTKEQNALSTRERKDQNATNITSAFADSCIQFPRPVMSILMRMLCLCLALMNFLFSIAPPSSSFVPMAVLKPRCVESEDYYHEALAFCRPSINLELDEENMKPEKATMAPIKAGIIPTTVKMKKWYQEPDRASDENSLTGTDRPSYQARELFGDDDERLAMRQGDMPPPAPERVANPRIREDRSVQDFQRNSEKMNRATHEDAYTRAWFDFCRRVFPQSVKKASQDIDLYNVSTYQCSIFFIEFRRVENMHKPQRHRRPAAVTSQRILEK